MSISGRRKKNKTATYESIKPELIDLSENLNSLGVDRNQFVVLAMIIGTDYNPGGIKGTGPKNALKIVKKYKTDFDSLFKDLKWSNYFGFPWTEVYYLIKKMPTTNDYKLQWKELNNEKIISMLVGDHDFSEERVKPTLEKLSSETLKNQQTSLGEF